MRQLIHFVHNFGIINLFLIFFFGINLLTFTLYGIANRRAIKNKNQISEQVLLFFTWFLGGIGALFAVILFKYRTKKLKSNISLLAGLIIAVIPLIHVGHALTLDRVIRYVEIDFYSEDWPAELNGYRIAFMTDMHAITDEDMAAVVIELNARNLDLLLLGGDFHSDVFWGGTHYQGTVRELSRAITTDGIFGVEGNHDVYDRLFEAKAYHGIGVLDNSGLHIRDHFFLAGVQDLWNRDPDIAEATKGANEDDFILLVSHNPDVSMLQPTNHLNLILSGHTHGGQITFFGWPFYLYRQSVTHYGTRFAHGWNDSADGVPIFTSRGIGPYYNWPRIFARPEVIIFTMNNEASE